MSAENYKTVFSEINEAEQIAAISFTFADRMKSVINSMAKEIQALEVERDEARLALKVYLENQAAQQPLAVVMDYCTCTPPFLSSIYSSVCQRCGKVTAPVS